MIQIVKDFDKVESEVSSSTHFLNDLGLDSLDAVELIMAFEDKFGTYNTPDVLFVLQVCVESWCLL